MTDTATDVLKLSVSRLISASPDRVYDAWLDPRMLMRFMRTCEGDSVTSATTDPREGGRFAIVMNNGEKDIPHAGTYLELRRAERLKFTWESPFSVDNSVVTVTLVPEGPGTRVNLTQVKFASEGARDGHIKGWTGILDMLATTLG